MVLFLVGVESRKTSDGSVRITDSMDMWRVPYETYDGHIVVDLTVADGNVFFFFRIS